MKSLHHILAATDLSAPARHAVDRAFRLAEATGATLDIIHVVSQSALSALGRLLHAQATPVEQHILDEARQKLGQLAADLGQAHGVSTGIHLNVGTVLNAILDQADAMDTGLLVLGARGEDYLSRLLLGTTAERLLRRAKRPILMVRQIPHEAYRRVLVPVDFSPWTLPALKLAREVAPESKLILLHVFELPFETELRIGGIEEADIDRYRAEARREAQNRLHALAADAGLPARDVSYSVQHGDVSRGILAAEQEHDCDLIVMGKHGQGVMEELLLGSVTKHILAEASCDVLISNHPERRG